MTRAANRLEWRPMAMADRESIMEFIARDNPAAALALDEAIEAQAEMARQRPTLYRAGRVKGTREAVVRPNYLLVYRVQEDGAVVVVLRVLHAAQRWPARTRLP